MYVKVGKFISITATVSFDLHLFMIQRHFICIIHVDINTQLIFYILHFIRTKREAARRNLWILASISLEDLRWQRRNLSSETKAPASIGTKQDSSNIR